MQTMEHVPLSAHSTMRLGGEARFLKQVTTTAELVEAIRWAKTQTIPFLVLGGGSNVIFTDAGFPGLVILNQIEGFEVLADREDGVVIQVGAGENWDSVVARTVEMGLTGIEALSRIPGTAGATPVQNVGAYGQEISQTLLELEAYDTVADQVVTLQKEACGFAYRTSIFNTSAKGRYAISSITLLLRRGTLQPPFYASLQSYLDEHGITEYSPALIREAVRAIREVKLPDPSLVANTGSFFKNPLVEEAVFSKIQAEHPEMPYFRLADGRVKLLAGWLIDQANLKGYAAHGMKTYEKNALVFVNEHATSYADLAAFKTEVIERVRQQFGVTLEQEPETI